MEMRLGILLDDNLSTDIESKNYRVKNFVQM